MGQASGALAASELQRLIERNGRVTAVFASAVSQNEFLEELASSDRVDWSRVTAFHLDEYVGITAEHPASFRRFLNEKMWSRVKPAAFHQLQAEAQDLDAEIGRYSELFEKEQPQIAFLGIGENGHLAFNDPPVDFEDKQTVRLVQLDEVCRQQQVNDGAFENFEDVPKTALTVTVPAIFRIPRLILNVPGPAKANAVQRTMEGDITPDCPASILQKHNNATLFVDTEAARLLTRTAR